MGAFKVETHILGVQKIFYLLFEDTAPSTFSMLSRFETPVNEMLDSMLQNPISCLFLLITLYDFPEKKNIYFT